MAYSPIHIISTMRGKDQYELDKDDRGKVTVKKLGVGAKQRDGFEYYFTTTFLIDRDSHMAKCEKDNTHIFENEGTTILDESHGSLPSAAARQAVTAAATYSARFILPSILSDATPILLSSLS